MNRIDVDRLVAAIHDAHGWDESNETEREFAERVATFYNRNPLVGKMSPKTQAILMALRGVESQAGIAHRFGVSRQHVNHLALRKARS